MVNVVVELNNDAVSFLQDYHHHGSSGILVLLRVIILSTLRVCGDEGTDNEDAPFSLYEIIICEAIIN